MLRKNIFTRMVRNFLIGLTVFSLFFLLCYQPVFSKAVDDFLVKLGKGFLEKGLFSDAEIECRKALIVNPDNTQAKACLAKIRRMRKNDQPQSLQVVCLGEEVVYEVTGFKNSAYSKYVWDFGDGVKKEFGAKATHSYLLPGRYTIAVFAEDFQQGLSYSSSGGTILVKVNQPPVADAGPNKVCCQGKEAIFDASNSYDPDGDNLVYFWDFGDGNTARGARVKHHYPLNGIYQVSLTVYDQSQDACNVATSGFTANVQASPVAAMEIIRQ
ncbi:MAG: PKD domain-containing protein [Candidatus Omnitrophica bacterium]|nr:PKD domain-containing protein [Candidatus Omnitrophota bacterium]